jgi:molybdopterin-guanine dinucleotide biosynthesis protein B
MKVIGIAGWSGSGKTTLLSKVIPRLTARGMKVSTLKHAHHAFDVDQPGKDSHAHRTAGATEVMVTSANRWALMHELRGAPEPELDVLLRKFSPVDLVIVEGFKAWPVAKIEIYRNQVGKPPLHLDDQHISGIASDTPFPNAGRPVVALDDLDAVVALMLEKSELLDAALARAAKARLASPVV